jgi:hypothetical protein
MGRGALMLYTWCLRRTDDRIIDGDGCDIKPEQFSVIDLDTGKAWIYEVDKTGHFVSGKDFLTGVAKPTVREIQLKTPLKLQTTSTC